MAQRLVARAFVLGLDSALSLLERAALLARLAVGSPGALENAAQRIEAGPDWKHPWAPQAVEALRVAARIATRRPRIEPSS